MKKTLLLMLMTIFASVSFSSKAEVLPFESASQPTQGVIRQFGNLRVFCPTSTLSAPNPECKEPVQLFLNDKLLKEIYTNSGASIIQIGHQQAENAVNFSFYTSPLTLPGIYRVVIPEGFLKFNGGEDENAAAEYVFSIYEPIQIEATPVEGFVQEMPRHVTLTFVGVSEVVNNERKPNGQNVGAIRFDNPEGFCYPEVTIEGNVMHLYFGENEVNDDTSGYPEEDGLAYARKVVELEDYMTMLGEYSLIFYDNDLTYVMPDGSTRNNFETKLVWIIPKMPVPTVTPEPGTIEELTEFNIQLAEGETFVMWNPMGYPKLYTYNELGQETLVKQLTLAESSADSNVAKFNVVPPVTEPGTYIIKLRKSSYSMTGVAIGWNDCDYIFTYQVTGKDTTKVESVEPVDGNADVYTASGILIGRDMDRESVDALPAGLYIVNGKKIIKH